MPRGQVAWPPPGVPPSGRVGELPVVPLAVEPELGGFGPGTGCVAVFGGAGGGGSHCFGRGETSHGFGGGGGITGGPGGGGVTGGGFF